MDENTIIQNEEEQVVEETAANEAEQAVEETAEETLLLHAVAAVTKRRKLMSLSRPRKRKQNFLSASELLWQL